ncbi:MAG: GDP-L-fucose synthase, partial [Cellulomonas sp.]|nr:GDP-L-fucose synthase [Cellulomonas sp.]
DHSIRDISAMVADAAGYTGTTRWDTSRADGTPRKLLDVSRLRGLGWNPSIALDDGIAATVQWYRENRDHVRS